jgi:hypothetical protein
VLAAGATNANVLSGSIFEFLTEASAVSLAALNTAGTGAALGVVTGKFTIGSRVISSSFPLKFKAGGIDADQDVLLADAGLANERLVLELVNTDGTNAQTVQFLVTVNPL